MAARRVKVKGYTRKKAVAGHSRKAPAKRKRSTKRKRKGGRRRAPQGSLF